MWRFPSDALSLRGSKLPDDFHWTRCPLKFLKFVNTMAFMFRFIALIALLLCITKATLGAVNMWNCEVERPHTTQVVTLNSSSTPQPLEASCPQFPHGLCNFLVAEFQLPSAVAPIDGLIFLSYTRYQNVFTDVPIGPPKA